MEMPEPNADPTSSIPAVTPDRAEGGNIVEKTPLSLKAAAELRRVTGRSVETYTAYGVTQRLFKECAKQASYNIPQAGQSGVEVPTTADGEDLGVGSGWWHEGLSNHMFTHSRTDSSAELGLKPTFSTWSQVTMLHMYFLAIRFRCLPEEQSQPWQQHLLDHFFYDAEDRMTLQHNIVARMTRNGYLKDLFTQWRGLLAAYDEGLMKGDAVLAAAVWRNLFKAQQDVDLKKVALVVAYMRSMAKAMESLPNEAVETGQVAFQDPKAQLKLVESRSQMMDVPIQEEVRA
jgi:cytochrome b pre-mRNA-processing protein 3